MEFIFSMLIATMVPLLCCVIGSLDVERGSSEKSRTETTPKDIAMSKIETFHKLQQTSHKI